MKGQIIVDFFFFYKRQHTVSSQEIIKTYEKNNALYFDLVYKVSKLSDIVSKFVNSIKIVNQVLKIDKN